MNPPAPVLDRIFRDEYGRCVAALIARFKDFDLAEDAVSEAIVVALQTWPRAGVPPNPGGWLTTTAHRKALDRIRREAVGAEKHRAAALLMAGSPAEDTPVRDDRLRLIFTCCHPALAPEARIALTLRLVGGLTVAEIARAFLVPERTLAQRITRAKRKIADVHIPYRVPGEGDLAARLSGVLQVLYLIFNEGYLATEGDGPRDDLAAESMRLTTALRDLMPAQPEVTGLLALQLLTRARHPARLVDGTLVPLDRQDRTRWDAALVTRGHGLVRECLALNRAGTYQIQAAIAAVHTSATSFAGTDWGQVVALYDQLLAVAPSPVVALNRAVAIGELDGPAVGLALIEKLPLADYPDWHAARGELLRRLGRTDEAGVALAEAVELSGNSAQASFFRSRLAALT